MKISIVGTGYVGLVQGVILAEFGMDVLCMDTQEAKIEQLQKGIIPIYEPGLKELLESNIKKGRLKFTTDMELTAEHGEVIFIAVGTPPMDDGSADLQYVAAVAEQIGRYLHTYQVIVNKSTVPVGTGEKVRQIIHDILKERNVEIPFDVVSNPEFLREGKAVHDCLHPDRVIIGTSSERALVLMKKVYDVLYINQTPFLFTDIQTAELVKYAANAFLAVKISYINEMALLADKLGANIQEVARAMGMDGRISPKFLHAGPGYGGSCFPKDTRAVVQIASEQGETMSVIEASIQANEKQKRLVAKRVIDELSQSKESKSVVVTVLGLSFKPETDDAREAPALDIIPILIKEGITVKVFCPHGMDETKWRLKEYEEMIIYCNDEYSAAEDSQAIILMTEWNQFRGLDLYKLRSMMKNNYFFDFRNIFAKNGDVRNIFQYRGIGCR